MGFLSFGFGFQATPKACILKGDMSMHELVRELPCSGEDPNCPVKSEWRAPDGSLVSLIVFTQATPVGRGLCPESVCKSLEFPKHAR